MRKRPGMRKPCGRNVAIIAIQEEQGRGNDEIKTKMRQTSGSCFFFFLPWQSNGEKVGENAGRQPDAIRFDVIG